jgi:hypothetical protein
MERTMKRSAVRRVSLAAALAFSSSFAHAQSAASSPDKVYLVDGTILSGTVIRQDPGRFVVIRMADGRETTLSWPDIKRVETGPRPTDSTPLPAAPAQMPTAAAPTSPVPAAPPSPAPATPQGPGTTSTTTDLGTQGYHYDEKTDCTQNPGQDKCSSEKKIDATDKGLTIGYHKETVRSVKAPKDSAVIFAVDGGFMYGTSLKSDASFSIYGGGANFNVRYRFGATFPGPDGGSWSGFGLDASAGVFGAGLVFDGGGAGLLMLNGGATIGYQYYHFGAMDPDSLKQHGIGFFVGGRGGVANTKVFSDTTVSSTDAQYGPQIEISFPEYNFGTAERSAFFLNFVALPTGDFLFAQFTAGGEF